MKALVSMGSPQIRSGTARGVASGIVATRAFYHYLTNRLKDLLGQTAKLNRFKLLSKRRKRAL